MIYREIILEQYIMESEANISKISSALPEDDNSTMPSEDTRKYKRKEKE